MKRLTDSTQDHSNNNNLKTGRKSAAADDNEIDNEQQPEIENTAEKLEDIVFNCMFLSCHVRRSLSDCNGTRLHNRLVREQTLIHLAKPASSAKWLCLRLRTKWLLVRVPLQALRCSFQFSRIITRKE